MRDDEKKKVHENLKQEIRSLLISSPKTKYGGLSGSLLYFDYKQLNCGKEIPYGELGFRSFLSLLRSMPDVVRIEYKENSPSYRVHPVYDQSTAHIQKMVLEQRDKYEYQNKLYIQNWYSNNPVPINCHNNGQFPFSQNSLPYYTGNSVQPNCPVYQNLFQSRFNNSYGPSNPQKSVIPNKRKVESSFSPYLLLTPTTTPDKQKQDEKINRNDINHMPRLSLKCLDNHSICSTPDTFIESPSNLDYDDYRLNESIKLSDKDIHTENNTNSSVNNQIEEMADDPLLSTSTNIISNELPNVERDQPLGTSPSVPIADDSMTSPTNNRRIFPSTIDEKWLTNNDIVPSTDRCHEQEQSQIDENVILKKRLTNAIRQCIYFRYIHRLCELKFESRHYPLSNEILSIRSKFEQIAFDQYQQDISDLEKSSELNSSIDDQKCQIMFDQYISLQRNYYYMIKLINKTQR